MYGWMDGRHLSRLNKVITVLKVLISILKPTMNVELHVINMLLTAFLRDWMCL